MPILKTKPVLDPKPPCGGCDECGDLREEGLYALWYNNKYYCHRCFFKAFPNWPRPMASNKLERLGKRRERRLGA